MIASELDNWERLFSREIEKIDQSQKTKAAILLPVVPSHLKWDDYTATVRTQWDSWKKDLTKYPACLVLLYAGLAFFEYDEHTFWPQFAKVVNQNQFSTGDQQEINRQFVSAAGHFGLSIQTHGNGMDFVGSAVHFVGIPLSLWEGFLEVCEWALWRKEWQDLSPEEWKEVIEKRSGSRQRLKKFLLDNRVVTNSLIGEVLAAREVLTEHPDFTISDVTKLIKLRPEYFDEISETSEFLRPQNPDSLFRDRARLIFDEQQRKIYLQLPGIKQDSSPATWQIGSFSQPASTGPDELMLNSDAFCDKLLLKLSFGDDGEVQRLRGISSWALFDMENGGCLVNTSGDEFRLKSYILLSKTPIQVSYEGFEKDDLINQPFELIDNSKCFITRLWPIGKYAEIKIKNSVGDLDERIIHFKTRNRIEARFFTGWSYKAAYFFRTEEGKIGMDHLPILCVAIPNAYFRDNKSALKQIFQVTIDGRESSGSWKRLDTYSSDKEFWEWKWSKSPLLEPKPWINKLTSLSQLSGAFRSADLSGDHNFAVKAGPYIRNEIQVEIVSRSNEKMDACWVELPGALLPLFLLCQSLDGLKWEDLLLAKDVVAPHLDVPHFILHKYKKFGFLILRGNRWLISQSRAELCPIPGNQIKVNYCGNPSTLWGLYRYLYRYLRSKDLPEIKVINKRSEIPYMQMLWPLEAQDTITQYFKRNNVILDKILWTQ